MTFPSISLVSWFNISLHILIYADTVSSSVVRTERVVGTFSGGNLWLVENKKYVVSVRNAFAKWHHQLRVRGMILHSVMLWKNHIRARHLYPRKQGKSCFFSVSEIPVWKMVEETFLYPDVQPTPHRSDENKIALRKKFYWPVGIHGRNGALCFSVTVIYDWFDRRIITAFPTTWIFKTFIFKFAKRN